MSNEGSRGPWRLRVAFLVLFALSWRNCTNLDEAKVAADTAADEADAAHRDVRMLRDEVEELEGRVQMLEARGP